MTAIPWDTCSLNQLEKRERRRSCRRTRAWMISCFTVAIAACRSCGVINFLKFSWQKLTCPVTGLKHKNSYALYQVMFLCSISGFNCEWWHLRSCSIQLGNLFVRSCRLLHTRSMCLGYYVVSTIALSNRDDTHTINSSYGNNQVGRIEWVTSSGESHC